MKFQRIAPVLLYSIGFVMLSILLLKASPSYANSVLARKTLVRDDAKIEQQVLDEMALNGHADFIVRFTEQADLSPAYSMDWKSRGEFVYKLLKETANRSQADAIAMLKAADLEYQTFIAGNDLYVKRGSLAAVNDISTLSEVSSIRAPRTYFIDPIINIGPFAHITWAGDLLSRNSITTVGNSIDAIRDWGLTNTHADLFWTSYGQGEGIVVANIDTGVQWNHPALDQSFKCGTNASDPSCWLDPSNICGGAACDNNGHGTHTMGTMVGDDDPTLSYSVGMAPESQWIACKGCESNSCSELALNSCADWILAPGGDPANRPNIVNNSWGGGSGDSWYQAKIQAWVAAGIFPAFAAGNTGPSCRTLNSPGDYQESFSTAAHDNTGNIANFSSRGPGAFGHDTYTKPNISAPGVNICSTVPTNSWDCSFNGTSMASPHTAGAVSLLWSCNPGLIGQVEQTFGILQDSAGVPVDGTCGAPPDGEGDYTYGYGYLDVYNAGVMVCNAPFGSLNGYVYDDNDNPINGAVVTTDTNQGSYRNKATTDSAGYYSMILRAGSYDVTAENVGFTSQTVTDVVIEAGSSTTQDFVLTANGWAYGYVTDQDTGLPVALATIMADDGSSSSTNDSGYYLLGLNPGSYTLTASAPGYTPESATVSISPRTGTPQDFIIQVKVKFSPTPIGISIEMGDMSTMLATVINHQTSDYDFEFMEWNHGYVPLGVEETRLNLKAGPEQVPTGSALSELEYQARPASTVTIPRRISAYRPNVLLLNADDDNTNGSPIQQMLLAYGDFGAIDLFDAGSATPTLEQLVGYDVVVVWAQYAFADRVTIGNVLADYVDAGGKVIDMMFAFYPGYGYEGRFRTERYSAMILNSVTITSSCLGVHDEEHPIMAGVTDVCDSFRGIEGTLTPDSYEVARWQDDELFIAVKENRSVASINGYAGYSFVWTGQMADVLHNAIHYLVVRPEVPWLSEAPISATVPAVSNLPVSIQFDASSDAGIIQPGNYQATLIMDGELDQPDINIPVTMAVTPPVNYGILQGTVIGLGYCDNHPGPLAGATIAVEGGISVGTDINGDYAIWLPAGNYSITVTSASHSSDSAIVDILPMGQVAVQDFSLHWEQPCLYVAPTLIVDSMLPGDIATHTLGINNGGSALLEYDFETLIAIPQILLHLDEPANSTVFLDSSGNHYNGSCSGASCPLAGGAGWLGSAVQFDGINDNIQVPNNPAFDLIESQGKITIAAWVNINNWSSGWFSIVDKHMPIIPFGWSFLYNASGALYFSSFPYDVSCPVTLNLHDWYHLAVSYDKDAGFISLYVNGSQLCEQSYSQPLFSTPGQPLYIGYSIPGGNSNGTIDELAIFSEALSSGDIQSLYLNGLTDPPWLSVAPLSGTVPSGDSASALVTLDAGELATGTYSHNLRITSNDPITPQVFVPVTLIVVSDPPEIPANPDPIDGENGVPIVDDLHWQASPHAEAYDLYLWEAGQAKPMAPIAPDLAQASYDPPGDLLVETAYKWQVIAKNAAGDTPGPEWSFTTGTPTAVLLTGFSTTSLPQGIQLEWQSAQELNLLGFNLFRADGIGGQREKINLQLIPGVNPGGLQGNDYQYLDSTIEAGKVYYYWIEWVEDGRSIFFGPVTSDIVRFKVWLPLGLR